MPVVGFYMGLSNPCQHCAAVEPNRRFSQEGKAMIQERPEITERWFKIYDTVARHGSMVQMQQKGHSMLLWIVSRDGTHDPIQVCEGRTIEELLTQAEEWLRDESLQKSIRENTD